MIVFACRFVILSTILLVIVWAGVLALSPEPEVLLTREETAFCRAFPRNVDRPFSLANELAGVRLPYALPVSLPGIDRLTLTAMLVSAALHCRVMLRFLPIVVSTIILGFVLGAILRERIRFGHGYASPALAFVAKRVLGIAASYLAIWALSPLPTPYWCLPVAGFVSLLGAIAYVSNLPVRL